MPTPWRRKRFPKTTVVFEKRLGASAFDTFGNPVIEMVRIPVVCYLRQTERNSSPEEGMTVIQVTLEGYCVEPKVLPPGIAPGAIGTAELNLNVSGSELTPVKGSFRLDVNTDYDLGLEDRLSRRLGQRIKGVFTYQVVWGNTVDVGIEL